MKPPYLLAAREGFQPPGVEEFYQRPLIELQVAGIDVSINRTALLVFIGTAVLLVLFISAFRKPKLVPRGLQNVIEAGIEFVRTQIVLNVMGPKGLPYLPYLATVFFFIFVLNVFEILPFINFPPTSRFGIPLFLAFLSFVLFVWAGIRTQGAGYFTHMLFPPGVPWYILPILTPIELVSNLLVRPATLAVRLLANMVAGHLLLGVFFLGTAYLLGRPATIPFGIVSAFMSVALVGFELFVAALQAFIFTTLTAVYIAGSLEPAH